MAYTPNYSYNYNLPNIDLGALMNQGLAGASSLMGQRYAGEGQLQDARLQNALELARLGYGSEAQLQAGRLGESGRQFDVSTGLTREQMRQAELQRQLENEAAIRGENWSRNLVNPAVSGAIQNNVNSAFAGAAPMLQDIEKRNREKLMFSAPVGGWFPGSYMVGQRPIGYAGFGGTNVRRG